MSSLWGQTTAQTYFRCSRIEISNPLNDTPTIIFYVDQEFLDASGNPVASVASGSWPVSAAQAAADATLGPLAQTLQTTLNGMAAYLATQNNPTVS